jgi:predicted enzyme related to lactoylglutathione lyase
MKVSEFAFVGHPVESLRRARLFYEKVLGLPEPKAIDGRLEGDQGFLEYEIGPHTLAITTTWTGGKPVDEPSSGLVLEVEDFAEAMRHLEENCVEFEMGPFEGPACSIAVILDPDGNRIGIHKRRAR